MHEIRTILIGGLILPLAAACSSESQMERPAPSPEVIETLPTAVPPEVIQQGSWAIPFVYEFPEGTWGVGFHRYALRVDCPILGEYSIAGEWRDFVTDSTHATLNTPVFLRLGGLSTSTLGPPNIRAIHPDQFTVAIVTLIGVTEEQAQIAAESDNCIAMVSWDGINLAELEASAPYQP